MLVSIHPRSRVPQAASVDFLVGGRGPGLLGRTELQLPITSTGNTGLGPARGLALTPTWPALVTLLLPPLPTLLTDVASADSQGDSSPCWRMNSAFCDLP